MTHQQKNKQRFPRRSAAQWQETIKRWEKSELSIDEFCQQESIGLVSFKKWRTRYLSSQKIPGKPPIPDFLDMSESIKPPVSVTSNKSIVHSQATSWDIELDFGAGVVCRFRRT